MSRVILVHGWGGSPERDWFPWASEELKKRGYEVLVPEMPDTENPKIEAWISHLAQVVGSLRPDDIFIGHSIGCQTILRFFAGLDNGNVSKVILIAPWGSVLNEAPDEVEIARPWKETPIDFEKARPHAKDWIAIFSDDDPFVPMEENAKVFEEKLNAKIVKVSKMAHFHEGAGILELPLLLEYI